MLPDKGTITFDIPYVFDESGNTISFTQDYINFLDSGEYQYNVQLTGQTPTYPYTGNTFLTYLGAGNSRINEKIKYGNVGTTEPLTYGIVDGISYTGYTFEYSNETIHYRDYDGGYTLIRGQTNGYTKEEVFDAVLSRNEHFLGFVEEPRIYSDVFVERGKQGVMERNLRLGEIDNVGELNVYGNGFFKVKKQ